MKCFIVASALTFLRAGTACAQLMQCETFDRSNTQAPQFVREWLQDDSARLYVRACGIGNYRYYHGAGDLAREGNVCHYLVYELDLSSTSPPRLERRMTPHATGTQMLISKSKKCPSPQTIHYVGTDHVPQDVFEDLVHVWDDAISSPASFDTAVSKASAAPVRGAADLRPLRNLISRGESRRLAVERISPDFGLRGPLEGYELSFTNPDHRDRCYAVLVLRSGRAYAITAILACWY